MDAHCHPHLDAHGSGLDALQPRHLALMSVSHDDWADVAAAASALGPKIVPCFGIHPWWSHLHGSHQCPGTPGCHAAYSRLLTEGATAPSTQLHQQHANMIISTPDQVDCAHLRSQHRGLHIVAKLLPHTSADKASMFEGSEKHLSAAADVIARLPDPLPRERWEAELRDRLRADPRAVVGEVGVDRAAVLPGTRVQTKFVHQQEIMEAHLALAGEFGRPVSIHCVRWGCERLSPLMVLFGGGCAARDAVPQSDGRAWAKKEALLPATAQGSGVHGGVFAGHPGAWVADAASICNCD